MDDKTCLYRECCFPNCKNHGERSYFRRFKGANRPPLTSASDPAEPEGRSGQGYCDIAA